MDGTVIDTQDCLMQYLGQRRESKHLACYKDCLLNDWFWPTVAYMESRIN